MTEIQIAYGSLRNLSNSKKVADSRRQWEEFTDTVKTWPSLRDCAIAKETRESFSTKKRLSRRVASEEKVATKRVVAIVFNARTLIQEYYRNFNRYQTVIALRRPL